MPVPKIQFLSGDVRACNAQRGDLAKQEREYEGPRPQAQEAAPRAVEESTDGGIIDWRTSDVVDFLIIGERGNGNWLLYRGLDVVGCECVSGHSLDDGHVTGRFLLGKIVRTQSKGENENQGPSSPAVIKRYKNTGYRQEGLSPGIGGAWEKILWPQGTHNAPSGGAIGIVRPLPHLALETSVGPSNAKATSFLCSLSRFPLLFSISSFPPTKLWATAGGRDKGQWRWWESGLSIT